MVVPQSDQLADQMESVRSAENTPAEKRAAVLLACSYAGRGLNLGRKQELREAPGTAALLLDALGLNGRRVTVNFSSGGLLSRGRR